MLVEGHTYCDAWILPNIQKLQQEKNAAQYSIYQKLVKEGIPNLFYIHGDKKAGTDDEATVEGTHLSDLGMMRTAEYLKPFIQQIVFQ